MSLLMDALKRAEEQKQFHEDEVDPHVLEWHEQGGSNTKIVKSVTVAKTAEKATEIPEVVTDSLENNQSLELAITENPLPAFSESHVETAEDLEIHSLESPTAVVSQVFEEKDLPADSAATLNWQDELIYPVAETSIAVTPDDPTAENRAPSKNVAPKAQKEPLILEEVVEEKDTASPQAAERLFAAAATPSITKRTVWLSGLLVVLVGLGAGGYFYLDTLLIGGSSLFLTKPGEKPFQRPVRQPVPLENTVPVAAAPSPAATKVEEERKVVEPTASEHTTRQVANAKPTGTLTADPAQLLATAQELVKQPIASHPAAAKEATKDKDKNVAKTNQKKPAAKLPASPVKDKPSPGKTSTSPPVPGELSIPPTLSPGKKVVSPAPGEINGSTTAQTTVIPPEEIKIIQTHRHNTIKGVLDATLTNAYRAFQQGDDATAQAAYTRVLRQDPNNRDVLLGLAAIALRNGRAQQAQHYYQQVLQLYPQDTVAQVGLVSTQGGNAPEHSESQLQTLLTRTPQAAYIHFNLGNLYARQGRWAQAQQAYFEAYRYDNNRADYAYNLAISLDQLNQSRLALTYYQRALELSQNRAQQDFNFDPQTVRKRLQTLTNSSN